MPMLVQGVPSMHICLDFVPKLLSHNDMEKQVKIETFSNAYLFKKMQFNHFKIFGINLAAELCEKYPIIRTFNVAKLAINVAFTVLQSNLIKVFYF